MIELAEKVKQLTNSSSELKYLPLPVDDPKQRRPDIGKAKKLINWSPVHELESGADKYNWILQDELNGSAY